MAESFPYLGCPRFARRPFQVSRAKVTTFFILSSFADGLLTEGTGKEDEMKKRESRYFLAPGPSVIDNRAIYPPPGLRKSIDKGSTSSSAI